jgi:hypothetical protein
MKAMCLRWCAALIKATPMVREQLPSLRAQFLWFHSKRSMGVCVYVNSTSGGGRSLATPTYQGRLVLVSLPLGAAVNKIKSATLILPSAQGRPLARLHPLSLEIVVQLVFGPVPNFSPRLLP